MVNLGYFLDKDADNLWEGIQYFYWKILPYDYRPKQLWYRFKCWAWKRYSTVRPRGLPHTWIDKDELLHRCMFELLARYLEDEADQIDWYSQNSAKIIPGQEWSPAHYDSPDAVFVRDEMQVLYDWYFEYYLIEREHLYDDYHNYLENLDYDWRAVLNHQIPDEIETKLFDYNRRRRYMLIKECGRKEEQLQEELHKMACRLIYVSPFMWS